jgi:SprT protein
MDSAFKFQTQNKKK